MLRLCLVSSIARRDYLVVPHSVVARALRRQGIDPRLAAYLNDGLTGCSTVISMAGRSTGVIDLGRSAKQGNSLPPFFHKFVLDELMEEVGGLPAGILVSGQRTFALAYACHVQPCGGTAGPLV